MTPRVIFLLTAATCLAACNSAVIVSSTGESSSSVATGGSVQAGSGGSTSTSPAGGSAPTGGSSSAGGAPADAGTDAPEPFEGYDPPYPGEYKPPNGPCPPCDGHAWCDTSTGFCCHGKFKVPASGIAGCYCGEELGCPITGVCCAFPGEIDYKCAASLEECPEPHP
jgi:hypothetical protein